MSSQIDPLVFRDNRKIDKADLRAQFQTAKEEISDLQTKSAIPYQMAYSDTSFDNL